MLDGEYRTSIIVDPANGRRPPMTQVGQARMVNLFRQFGKKNEGTAWWIDQPGSGPYDDPEQRPLGERVGGKKNISTNFRNFDLSAR